MLFGKNKQGGFMDEIRCDEPSYLIWKWHPVGSQQGDNKREIGRASCTECRSRLSPYH